MDCKKCPDREFCYSINAGSEFRNKENFQLVYLRTLRCRKKKFGG